MKRIQEMRWHQRVLPEHILRNLSPSERQVIPCLVAHVLLVKQPHSNVTQLHYRQLQTRTWTAISAEADGSICMHAEQYIDNGMHLHIVHSSYSSLRGTVCLCRAHCTCALGGAVL